jgi:acyl carrier protein
MSEDLTGRLESCMRSVFPKLDAAAIRTASAESVEEWDSLATITLVSLIEEEFVTQIAVEDLERFVSFEAIMDLLEQRVGTEGSAI